MRRAPRAHRRPNRGAAGRPRRRSLRDRCDLAAERQRRISRHGANGRAQAPRGSDQQARRRRRPAGEIQLPRRSVKPADCSAINRRHHGEESGGDGRFDVDRDLQRRGGVDQRRARALLFLAGRAPAGRQLHVHGGHLDNRHDPSLDALFPLQGLDQTRDHHHERRDRSGPRQQRGADARAARKQERHHRGARALQRYRRERRRADRAHQGVGRASADCLDRRRTAGDRIQRHAIDRS